MGLFGLPACSRMSSRYFLHPAAPTKCSSPNAMAMLEGRTAFSMILACCSGEKVALLGAVGLCVSVFGGLAGREAGRCVKPEGEPERCPETRCVSHAGLFPDPLCAVAGAPNLFVEEDLCVVCIVEGEADVAPVVAAQAPAGDPSGVC
jgi:hypothetical protein